MTLFKFLARRALPILVAAISLSSHAQEVLRVGASPVPHAEILEFVKAKLKTQGVDLQIKVFTDYVQPNLGLEDKQLDANYFPGPHGVYAGEANLKRFDEAVRRFVTAGAK